MKLKTLLFMVMFVSGWIAFSLLNVISVMFEFPLNIIIPMCGLSIILVPIVTSYIDTRLYLNNNNNYGNCPPCRRVRK